MRQFLFLWLVLAGVGCQGLQGLHEHRCRPECPVEECKKPVSSPAPKEKVGAPAPETPTRVAAAQEVLLVPTVVYRPFVSQTPTQAVKLTSNMTVLPQQPEQVGAPRQPDKVGAPTPPESPPERICPPKMDDTLRRALEQCDRLEARCADLEKRLRQCPAPAPTPPCALPFWRRALFQRCEPGAPCDPQTPMPMPMSDPGPGVPPAINPPSRLPMAPADPSSSAPAPPAGDPTPRIPIPSAGSSPVVNID